MSLLQSLDEELICAVCLEFYETPLLLPCGHNFCKKCLVNISESASFSYMALGPVSSLSCPVCKATLSLRKTAINQLPVNRILESIISLYKSNSPVDIFDSAWNSDADIQVASCPTHHIPMDQYCVVCDVAVCRSCEPTHNKTNGRHRIEPVTQIATKYQADIADILTEIKMKNVPLNDRIKKLQESLDGVEMNEECLKKELTEGVGSVMSAVRKRQEELQQQLRVDIADTRRPVIDQLARCTDVKTLVHELMKKLSSIKKTRNAGMKIKLMKNARKQLSHLLNVDFLLAFQSKTPPQATALSWQLPTQPFLDQLNCLKWEKTGVAKPATVNAATQTIDATRNTSSIYKPHEVDLESETKFWNLDNNWMLPAGVNELRDKQHRSRSSSAKGGHKGRQKKYSSSPLRTSSSLKPVFPVDKEIHVLTVSGKADEYQQDVHNLAVGERDTTEHDYLKSGNVSSKAWVFNFDSKAAGDTSNLTHSLDAISLSKKAAGVRKSYPPGSGKQSHLLTRNDHSFNFVPRVPSETATDIGNKRLEIGNTDKTSQVLATFVARRKATSPSKSPSRSRLEVESSPRLHEEKSQLSTSLVATTTSSLSEAFKQMSVNSSLSQDLPGTMEDNSTTGPATGTGSTPTISSSVISIPANNSPQMSTSTAAPNSVGRPKISFSITRTSSSNSPTFSLSKSSAASAHETSLVTSSSPSELTQVCDSDTFSTCSESSIPHPCIHGFCHGPHPDGRIDTGRKIKKLVPRKLRR